MIAEEIAIRAPLPRVYEAFADLSFWARTLADVVDVQMLYEDTCHQEFTMTVERSAGQETIRGVRFLSRNRKIELFQPQPPPGFQKMTGVWSFTPVSGAVTRARATRQYVATGHVSELRLREYLRRNLETFRRALEEQS